MGRQAPWAVYTGMYIACKCNKDYLEKLPPPRSSFPSRWPVLNYIYLKAKMSNSVPTKISHLMQSLCGSLRHSSAPAVVCEQSFLKCISLAYITFEMTKRVIHPLFAHQSVYWCHDVKSGTRISTKIRHHQLFVWRQIWLVSSSKTILVNIRICIILQ